MTHETAQTREALVELRVCPKRDAICPHGMSCPYVIDRYDCQPEPASPYNAKDKP